jgi:hypothetical protein
MYAAPLTFSDAQVARAIKRVARRDGTFELRRVAQTLGCWSSTVSSRLQVTEFLEHLASVHPRAAEWASKHFARRRRSRKAARQEEPPPDFCGDAPLPREPAATAMPGSAEKVLIMAERARRGENLFHPQDTQDCQEKPVAAEYHYYGHYRPPCLRVLNTRQRWA